MKLKNFFFASVALVSMFACSSEDQEMDEMSRAITDTYMTVQVEGINSKSTRTQADGDKVETGRSEEGFISNLMVLLYDMDGVMKKAYVTDQMNNTPDGAQTSIIPIGVGDYEVYVIANYSDRESSWEIQPGDVKELTIDEVTPLLMKNKYAMDNHFIMFNECNGKNDVKGVSVKVNPENTSKYPARCTVKLDRLAVKIQSGVDDLDIQEMIGHLGDKGFANVAVSLKAFKLLNGATQTYLQQRWTNDKALVWPYKNTLITPWLVSGDDPVVFNYYNRLSEFRTVTKSVENQYLEVRDNFADITCYGNTSTSPIFCMENNPTWNGTMVVDAMKGNTTGLVYQFAMSFEGSDRLAGANCFYSYGRQFFPSLDALYAEYPKAFEPATSSRDEDEDLAAAKAELAAAYQGADPNTAISEFRAKYKIKVYMDGLMYYIYYIKDSNYLEGSNKYYAIMRNSIYDLTVKQLLRVGDDIPGGWNPDTKPVDPVDPTKTYMNVFVKVNPWVMNSEDIDLK